MKRTPPTRKHGLETARKLKILLQKKGFPVQGIFLFGSIAKGIPHEWSDIDIAVIHQPFGENRFEEMRSMCNAEAGADLHNIEVLYFHPDDLNDKYSTIAREVKEHGIAV